MEICGLMSDVNSVLRRVVENASNLIYDVTNNACEQFNSVINKYISGKRINFSLKQSYNTRVQAAIISYNTSGNFLRAVHKKLMHKSPGMVGKKFLISKKYKHENLKKRRLFNSKKSKKIKYTGPDEFYGLAEPLPIDERCSIEELEFKKKNFIQTITLSKYQRDALEIDTREQSSSSRWFMERRNRITASDFGKICKMRPTTSCKNIVANKLYSTSSSTNEPIACKYGKDMEPVALEYFENNMGTKIQKCGLIIDEDYPFFGASPDGLIGNDSIIEVKCPYSAKDYPTVEEAIKDKKVIHKEI
ncbi:uncharacterized protein LOC111030182 [Myzus persicae]|uniref:uncharacterized protein LOC111030182 n=1 Tax=Myzus persicae TaxID=13164 RepID=UPI000B934494|nr:uncharacterized protein LOC111030182 [Myzus persicae]